jgi:cysteine synthase A
VARYWTKKNPKARVVCIFPDDGYRYTDTIYNDEYLWNENLWLPELPDAPAKVEHPLDAGPGWTYMDWGRRAYGEIVKRRQAAAV